MKLKLFNFSKNNVKINTNYYNQPIKNITIQNNIQNIQTKNKLSINEKLTRISELIIKRLSRIEENNKKILAQIKLIEEKRARNLTKTKK